MGGSCYRRFGRPAPSLRAKLEFRLCPGYPDFKLLNLKVFQFVSRVPAGAGSSHERAAIPPVRPSRLPASHAYSGGRDPVDSASLRPRGRVTTTDTIPVRRLHVGPPRVRLQTMLVHVLRRLPEGERLTVVRSAKPRRAGGRAYRPEQVRMVAAAVGAGRPFAPLHAGRRAPAGGGRRGPAGRCPGLRTWGLQGAGP